MRREPTEVQHPQEPVDRAEMVLHGLTAPPTPEAAVAQQEFQRHRPVAQAVPAVAVPAVDGLRLLPELPAQPIPVVVVVPVHQQEEQAGRASLLSGIRYELRTYP
jgi:hypothetical protein